MAQNELPPMAPGGEWLHDGSHRTPLYVVHEAHTKRLLSEGWRPTSDPRQPVEAKSVEPSEKDKLMAQLAAALARIEALEARGASAQPSSADDPDDTDDGDAKPARKPRK